MTDPALPWALPVPDAEAEEKAEAPEEQKSGSEEQSAIKFLTLESAGVAAGGRIEVSWQVEPDEGEAYFRWWGATVVGPSEQKDADRPEAPVYELLYDSHEDFEQERGHVIFVTDHALRQLDQADELAWRREGDMWDGYSDDDDSSQGEEATDGDALLTMDDLKELGDKFERRELGGRKLEDVEQEALQSMEPSKRIAMAAGFRDFADNLLSFLQERMSAEDGGVVTAEHVKAFTESLQKKQRTR